MDFWQLSNLARRQRVENFIETKTTDVERWFDSKNADGALDHSRSRFVGRFIPENSSVLDLGCGSMALKQYLPPSCRYTPADIVPRSRDSIVVDLNKNEFPAGRYDCIVILGVLEYIFDVQAVLEKCRSSCARIYVDYNSKHLNEIESRRNCGWVSDLSVGNFVDAAINAGWKNLNLIKVVDSRYFYICDHELVTIDMLTAE